MKCENIYCIYQRLGKCTLKNIQIDLSGTCSERIYVNVDESVLKDAKKQLLKKYENDL